MACNPPPKNGKCWEFCRFVDSVPYVTLIPILTRQVWVRQLKFLAFNEHQPLPWPLTEHLHNQQNTQLTQNLTDKIVIPKLLLKSLVIAQPILLVAFTVVIGGYALAANAEDWTASFLWYLAMTILALLAVDTVLLVGVLGLRALEEEEARSEKPSHSAQPDDTTDTN